MTDTLLAGTTPVFEIDDEREGVLARDLVRMEVDEGTDGLKALQARFLAFGPREHEAEEGLLYLDGRLLDFGKRIRVSIGPPDDAWMVFNGFVSALEFSHEEGQEPEVLIFAEDRCMDLRMTRRMHTYEDMSDADIAREIADEHGLRPDVDAEGPIYDVVQQWNMSDLAFLRERARLVQAEVYCRDDTLHFVSRPRRSGTEVTLVRGNHLIAVSIRADLAHQRTSVVVSGFDADRREQIAEAAEANVLAEETRGGSNGPEILERAFGERISYRVREVPLTGGEAEDWAHNEMLRRCRGFVQVMGITSGTGNLTVGSRLRLERVGEPFEGGDYHVTRVRHTYDLESGFRTHFTAERATVNGNR